MQYVRLELVDVLRQDEVLVEVPCGQIVQLVIGARAWNAHADVENVLKRTEENFIKKKYTKPDGVAPSTRLRLAIERGGLGFGFGFPRNTPYLALELYVHLPGRLMLGEHDPIVQLERRQGRDEIALHVAPVPIGEGDRQGRTRRFAALFRTDPMVVSPHEAWLLAAGCVQHCAGERGYLQKTVKSSKQLQLEIDENNSRLGHWTVFFLRDGFINGN